MAQKKNKVVMPKNSALLDEIEAVLEVYASHPSWISNEQYKKELKEIIGSNQYPSSYTKKMQVTSYFGFTEWQTNNVRAPRRITESGRRFHNALISDDLNKTYDELLDAIENVTFGRNNFGCPESDSDVEPPKLCIRAICDLGYITASEFAYLLFRVADCRIDYNRVIDKIKFYRKNKHNVRKDIPSYLLASYTDAKPLIVLKRWGFFDKKFTHYRFSKYIKNKYFDKLKNLPIYNVENIIIESDTPVIPKKPPIKKRTDVMKYFNDPELIFNVLYSFLWEGKTYRQIDEQVLLINSSSYRGMISLNILGNLGIREEFKGKFRNYSINQVLELISVSDDDWSGLDFYLRKGIDAEIVVNNNLISDYSLKDVSFDSLVETRPRSPSHGSASNYDESVNQKKKVVGSRGETIVGNFLSQNASRLHISDLKCWCQGPNKDDSKGYDYSYTDSQTGKNIMVEVKTTVTDFKGKIHFEMSENEMSKLRNDPENYYIFFIDNLSSNKTIKRISGKELLGKDFKPTHWLVYFNAKNN